MSIANDPAATDYDKLHAEAIEDLDGLYGQSVFSEKALRHCTRLAYRLFWLEGERKRLQGELRQAYGRLRLPCGIEESNP